MYICISLVYTNVLRIEARGTNTIFGLALPINIQPKVRKGGKYHYIVVFSREKNHYIVIPPLLATGENIGGFRDGVPGVLRPWKKWIWGKNDYTTLV